MQVFLHIVAFSLQTGGSGRPVLTKGKRLKFLVKKAIIIIEPILNCCMRLCTCRLTSYKIQTWICANFTDGS